MKDTIRTLESNFKEIVDGSYPYDWDEDHITFQLMKKLRETFTQRTINFPGWSKIVNMTSFKNRGTQETSYGDIALLINIQFTSGEILKGVAYLEAKRTSGSNNFDALIIGQIDRIHRNAPYSHLLFYNHRIYEINLKFPDESSWYSHFWVSPINTAKEHLRQLTSANNRQLLRTSFPFSSFLTSRIFWGLDLDYRADVYEDIERGIARITAPKYLGVVNIFYEDQTLIQNEIGSNWEEI